MGSLIHSPPNDLSIASHFLQHPQFVYSTVYPSERTPFLRHA